MTHTISETKLVMHGRITVENSGEMRLALSQVLRRKPAEMHVDFSDVSYMDTSAAATLVEAGRIARTQGTRLVLSAMQGQPRFLFKITSLDHLFEMSGEVQT